MGLLFAGEWRCRGSGKPSMHRPGIFIKGERFVRSPSVVVSFLFGLGLLAAGAPVQADRNKDERKKEEKEITFIHMGDIHGHLLPRPNLRSDGDRRMEGGLARMYTRIKEIRRENRNTLLFNTGDTIQGSGEALFTQGKAMIEVLDLFGIDAYAPGNWDFVYGTAKFREHFAGGRWGALSANLYDAATNANILKPSLKITRGNVTVGIVGCTTTRGPQVVGAWTTAGLKFTDCGAEVRAQAAALRAGGVDLVVMVSEQELARNIQLVESLDRPEYRIDAIFNSDMHEETRRPIKVYDKLGNPTLIVEEGQDGTMLGELKAEIRRGRVAWEWKAHRIHDGIAEDKVVKAKVDAVRYPYTQAGFKPAANPAAYTNPINNTVLKRPLEAVVGYTSVALHRSNFSDEQVPAVLEGTSHNLITDAMRWKAGADWAALRGFRYGTHVKPGPVTMNDLYHFIPIGPRIGTLMISPNQLRTQIENSALSTFSANPSLDWRGGWMFGYSGLTMQVNPYRQLSANGVDRYYGVNVRVNGTLIMDAKGDWTTAVKGTNPDGTAYDRSNTPMWKVAGYWFEKNPATLNGCQGCTGTVIPVDDASGNPLDIVEAVVEYLAATGPANPSTGRVTAAVPLPPPQFGFPELQPLRGAAGL